MTDLPKRVVSLLDAARVVAQGGDLDSKLAELAGQAMDASGAEAASVFLMDALGEHLVLAAAAGQPSGPAPSTIDVAGAPLALQTAVTDRVAQTLSADQLAQLYALPSSAAGAALIPLVATDQVGDPELEGVLLATHADPDSAAGSEPLLALADLVAVAVRQARLENTLLEQTDWLNRVAATDPLTGLANRPTFYRMLQLEVARAGRQGSVIGLSLFAVEGLDELAAREGAGAGDDALRRIAATMADQLRIIDTVARIDTATFAAICPGSGGPEAATRIRDTVNAAGAASVRVAVASFPADGEDADALVAAAHQQLETVAAG